MGNFNCDIEGCGKVSAGRGRKKRRYYGVKKIVLTVTALRDDIHSCFYNSTPCGVRILMCNSQFAL